MFVQSVKKRVTITAVDNKVSDKVRLRIILTSTPSQGLGQKINKDLIIKPYIAMENSALCIHCSLLKLATAMLNCNLNIYGTNTGNSKMLIEINLKPKTLNFRNRPIKL